MSLRTFLLVCSCVFVQLPVRLEPYMHNLYLLGAGKTMVAAKVAQCYAERDSRKIVIMVVDRINLVFQQVDAILLSNSVLVFNPLRSDRQMHLTWTPTYKSADSVVSPVLTITGRMCFKCSMTTW